MIIETVLNWIGMYFLYLYPFFMKLEYFMPFVIYRSSMQPKNICSIVQFQYNFGVEYARVVGEC